MKFLWLVLPFFIISCSPDPGAYKVPKRDREIIKNGNIVNFSPKIDVLFIVDDSGSMGSHQAHFALNSQLFIDEITKSKFIDYHIGVTTSTTDFSIGSKAPMGRLMQFQGFRYVTPTTVDGPRVMGELLKVGTNGSFTEKFLNVPALTFSEDNMLGVNKGFYREDAQLAIFIITDAVDQSDTEANDIIDFLIDLKGGDTRKIHFVTAIIDQVFDSGFGNGRCNHDSSTNTDAIKMKEVVSFFQERGYLFELCEKKYGTSLATVAQSIVKAVSTINLDKLPDIRTIKVTLAGEEIPEGPDGWTYDDEQNAIILSTKLNITADLASQLSVEFEDFFKEDEE